MKFDFNKNNERNQKYFNSIQRDILSISSKLDVSLSEKDLLEKSLDFINKIGFRKDFINWYVLELAKEYSYDEIFWVDDENEHVPIVGIGLCGSIRVHYHILPNQRLETDSIDGYYVERIDSEYKYESGILGCVDGEVGICLSNSLYNAIGLPGNFCHRNDIDELRDMAQKDANNLISGKDVVLSDHLRKFY